MKNRAVLIAFIFLFGIFAYGGNFQIEVMGHYFQPSEKAFKDIYGSAMSYGGELTISLWKWIAFWAGGDYFSKNGTTTFTEEETKIRIVPFYAGIKFQLKRSSINPYAGFGLGYFQYKETNPIGKVEKSDLGYIGQLGCLFKIVGSLFIDVKGSYSYCKAKPMDVEADLGGVNVGIGIGFEIKN